MSAASHAACEAILAAAMRAEDPVAALLEAAERHPDLDPTTRDALRRVDPDGVRMQALLVARLRFERLLHGSATLAERFERDPAAVTHLFRRYHREIPMHPHFPADEAAAFEAWDRRNL